MALELDDIVVPWELTLVQRRALRRFHCTLCRDPLDGARAVASTIDSDALTGDLNKRPLWVAHHRCYVEAFRLMLRKVPELARAPSEDEAHATFRAVLNKRAARSIT